jgi:hypothetical protein
MFNNMEARFTSFDHKLADNNSQLAANNDKLSENNLKIDRLLNRISELEARSNQQENQITDLQSRLQQSENRFNTLESRVGSIDTTVAGIYFQLGWEPCDVPKRKILALGDSNFSGKIKFGSTKGTLGKSLPGNSMFTPEHDQLPEPNSDQLKGYSDIIIATGTNDLSKNNCNAEGLSRDLYRYIKGVLTCNPATQIILPGVLPTMSVDRNNKIDKYNRLLDDMCRVHPRLTFVDLNNFRGNNGKLADKLAIGGTDSVHLNDDGIKLYASKIKNVLRVRHHLPTSMNYRSRPRGEGNDGPGTSNQSDSRGGGRGSRRGHRGGLNRGRS